MQHHVVSSRRITVTKSIKPKRRFLQFSLRTLLVVMLVVCVTLGWKVNKARKQREAVAWVQECGGTLFYDYEFDGGPLRNNPQPPGPQWLRELLGIDFLDDVVFVSLHNDQVTDVTLLAGLTSLEGLEIGGTQVSDLSPLAGLTSLELLLVDNTQVSDMTPLAGLTRLKWLAAIRTQVSDVTPLAGLTRLQELDIANMLVSQEDYEMLREALPNCDITWSRAAESP